MNTQGVTQSGSAVNGSSTSGQVIGKASLGKDDFLKLLITQLTHQDPLNPLDQNQFLSQTAQFTQLEELQNIAKGLGDLTAASAASNVAQSAALLGKTVTVAGSDFAFDGAQPVQLPYTVNGAAVVRVDVMDQDGNLLRSIDTSATGAGTSTVTWDGKDSSGNALMAGRYYYRVSAPNGSGAVAAATEGTVTGFTVTGGALRYQIGTAQIRPEDIIQVRQPA